MVTVFHGVIVGPGADVAVETVSLEKEGQSFENMCSYVLGRCMGTAKLCLVAGGQRKPTSVVGAGGALARPLLAYSGRATKLK
jgi:hypothetical protein